MRVEEYEGAVAATVDHVARAGEKRGLERHRKHALVVTRWIAYPVIRSGLFSEFDSFYFNYYGIALMRGRKGPT
jgi:hypothetical protein